MKTATRWAIIGPGRIAHRFAAALSAVEGAGLYAVASRSTARAAAFAHQYGAEVAYDDYAALCRDPAVDAVYIATPHNFHAAQAMMCLQAGQAVLCEKPLTVNARQAQTLIREAGARQVFLMEALWTRFLPIYQQVKLWLAQGAIGQVRHITSEFGIKFSPDPESRIYNPHLAGGILLDGNVYSIAMTQWLLGVDQPRSIQASGFIGPTGVDESLMVNLCYGDGLSAQFYGGVKSTHKNNLTIYGTQGHITLHGNFWESTRATLHNARGELPVTRPFECNGFEYQLREVVSCLARGLTESAVMPHRQTLANMALMDAIRQQIGLTYPFE